LYSPRIYTDDRKRTPCIATFHKVLHPDIAAIFFPGRLYVKVPTNISIKFPFDFTAFSTKTLRCIVRALGISPFEYNTMTEKQDYRLVIESSYEKNIIYFNDVVLVQCGIFVGYLKPSKYEVRKAYRSKRESYSFEFDYYDFIFDAVQIYRARFACFLGFIAYGGCLALLLAYLGCLLFYLLEKKILIRWRVFSHYSRALQDELDRCNIKNLASLETLYNGVTTDWCPFNSRVFLLDNGRIIMLSYVFLDESYYLREEQARETAEHDFNLVRMWDQIRAAKPSFIARLRATQYQVVAKDNDQLNDCCICYDQITSNSQYAQWPCPAGHYFHLECMVKALRESNRCPLCRYEVEGVPLPDKREIQQWYLEMSLTTSMMEWRELHYNDS
ncbi:unnamed protein product, partial [Rotaria sordida]